MGAFMVIAAIGTVFAAGYLLWLFQRVAFGTPTEEFANDPHIVDVQPTEYVTFAGNLTDKRRCRHPGRQDEVIRVEGRPIRVNEPGELVVGIEINGVGESGA